MASQPLSKVISNEEYSPNVRIFNDILEETESIFKQQSEILKLLNTSSINLRSFCDILYDIFKSGLNASEVLMNSIKKFY